MLLLLKIRWTRCNTVALTLCVVNVSIVCMTIWKTTLRGGNAPLYRQLADAIEQGVASGALAAGEKLPTHRDLADQLQINVSTVTRGYKEAEKRGIVAATVGRGTYISSDVGMSSSLVPRLPYRSGMIDLGIIAPLYHLDPDLKAGLKKLCRRQDLSPLMHYSDPCGTVEHRSAGAQWAKRFGLDVTADDIVVCAGAQHALNCGLNGLFSPGDRIATAEYTYPGMKTLCTMLGLRLVPVKVDESGLVAESLDRICRREKIKGLYVMPSVHNPTTTTLVESRLSQLAHVAAMHDLTVIEDDTYNLSRPLRNPPVRSLLTDNGVYIAGISKAFAAGLRVAFMIVSPQYRHHIRKSLLNTLWMTPPLNAEIVSLWIKDGTAEEVIVRKRNEARKRYKLAKAILGSYSFKGIETGYFIWLSLPSPWRGDSFAHHMRELGVNVFGAENFIVGDAVAPAAVRISLTGTRTTEELAKGLQLIKKVLDSG